MAVINTVDDVFTHPKAPAEFGGARVLSTTTVVSIGAGDNNNSIYFIAELPDSAVLDEISAESIAIANATDIGVGLYNTDGSVINKDLFAANLDFSSISGLPVGPLGDGLRQCMTGLALTDANKKLYELAGHVNKAFPASGETNRKGKYRIAATADAINGAGTIVFRVKYRMYN